MKVIVFILCILVIAGCTQKDSTKFPDTVTRFVQVYVELVMLEDRLTTQHSAWLDSSKIILRKLHFTKQDYDFSVVFLNEKPERWEIFYQEVQKQLRDNNTPKDSTYSKQYTRERIRKILQSNKSSEAVRR